MKAQTNNLVVVADSHCGCQLGLMAPQGIVLKGGQRVKPSPFQRWLWRRWLEFWHEFVPVATHKEPFDIGFNGDIIDNRHHGTTTLVTHNRAEMAEIARGVFAPVLALPQLRRWFHVEGTEVHDGPASEDAEELALEFNAVPGENGKRVRPELWLRIGMAGRHRALVHLAHHIGTAGVTAYETTALHREMVEAQQHSARWRNDPPDVVIRSHRHIPAETKMPTGNGIATALVTPGWQGKTPYVYRLLSGRVGVPMFGGVVVRSGDMDTFTRSMVWSLKRTKAE